MTASPALKRSIRFRDLALFYVVSGLSVRWTAMAAAAGPSILVVWVAALICFFVPLAASVAELSSRHPDEGGLYVWTREAFGGFSGFIAAWTYWMSNLPFFPGVLYFGAASALFAFGPRAQALAGSPGYYVAFAVGWLAIITLLNIRGVDAGKWLNNFSALGALVPLAALILLAAASYGRFGAATHFVAGSLVPHLTLKNAVFWSSVFFAFGGVEAGSSMGDEIENPRRVIPWAILLGGSVLAIGYIAGTAALLVALPSEAVGGPDGFINGIHIMSARLGIEWLLAPMALFVALNAVGSAAAYLSSTSRLPFVAGIHHCLPPAFGWIHPRYRTPWVAIGVYGLAGICVTLLGQAGTSVRGAYEVLVSMAVISYFVPYLFLFGSMIRLQSRPAGPEVRRVPGGKPVAIMLGLVGLASTAMTILLSAVPADDEPNKPLALIKVVGGTIVMVAAGMTVFLLSRRKARRMAREELKR
jgi:amino acid transporter